MLRDSVNLELNKLFMDIGKSPRTRNKFDPLNRWWGAPEPLTYPLSSLLHLISCPAAVALGR